MSESRRQTKHEPAHQCDKTGKTLFRSAVAARACIDALDEWRGETARVYRYPFCSWFHLTSARTIWQPTGLQQEAS